MKKLFIWLLGFFNGFIDQEEPTSLPAQALEKVKQVKAKVFYKIYVKKGRIREWRFYDSNWNRIQNLQV